MAQYPQRIGEPDCRDFLRTGRCKYGESCKYHHPANVQSGGGIKTLLDPSEPPFPLRPHEPNCQYYMKHGTCKFGQTCKFNHPPNLIGVGSMNKQQGYQSSPVLGSSPTSSIPNECIVILPQRPNEPDCIYFLKNGRCKYGSTCKYNHPLSYQRVNIGNGRESNLSGLQQQPIITRQSQSRPRSYSTNDVNIAGNGTPHVSLPMLTTQSVLPNQQPVQSHTGPTHMLLPEGQIAVMLNHPVNKGNPTFQNGSHNQFLPIRSGQQNININSSSQPGVISSPVLSSSISSYDTTSSFELLGPSYGASSSDNVQRWQRSSSQQHMPNSFPNNFSSHESNNRHGVPSRHAPHHYVMMARPGSNDKLYSNEMNQTPPVRHNQNNMLKLANSEPSNERRTVSLGSSAEIGFRSLESNRQRSTQSLQHGWESNTSLSTLSTRFRDDNRVNVPSPQQNNGYLLSIGDSSFDSSMHREIMQRNINSELPMHAPKTSWTNGETRQMMGLANSSSIPKNMQHISNRRDVHGNILDSVGERNNSEKTDYYTGMVESHSAPQEDDGLSNMTSALLNMLDTSEDSVSKAMNHSKFGSELESGYDPGRRSSLETQGNSDISNATTRVDMPSQLFISPNKNNYSKLNKESNMNQEENRTEIFPQQNPVSPPKFREPMTWHAVANGNPSIQPQSSTSNVGLYLS